MEVDPLIRKLRRSERKPTVLIAKCKKGDLSERVIIYDLTAEGCLIAMGTLQASEGRPVTIRPEGLEAFTGTIRWIRDGRAGIQFDRPLYGPVAEHLQRKHATFVEVEQPKRKLRSAC